MSSTSRPEGVNCYHGRLETFKTAHHLAKRRASSTRKRVPTTATWPHKSPSPDDVRSTVILIRGTLALTILQMASAGFFYNPGSDSRDNATCFLCRYNLDGWEQDDDPFQEHLKHSPRCGFAIMMATGRQDDQTLLNVGPEADPMSDHILQARMETFLRWPHDGKKGWKAKSKKVCAPSKMIGHSCL
jgi:Inhibitor of Apoptosis domain